MATEILIKGIPGALKPSPQADNQREGVPIRLSRYGGQFVEGVIPTKHGLADEGSYFSANNAQTGQITLTTGPSAFVATTPAFIIYNNVPASPTATKIYMDYALWSVTVAGASITSVQAAIVRDNTNRFSTLGAGGVLHTAVMANSAGPASIAKVWSGQQLVATAASANAVSTVGQRQLRLTLPVAGDNYALTFGSVDNVFVGMNTTTTTPQTILQPVPALVLNPGECGLIYLWYPGIATTGITLLPEFGWWER